jgi:hypothetical protein
LAAALGWMGTGGVLLAGNDSVVEEEARTVVQTWNTILN